MTLGAYIRDVHGAGFLLRRCLHSLGAIAGCPGQHNYRSVPNQKKQTHFFLNERHGRFGPILGPVSLEVDYFLGSGKQK